MFVACAAISHFSVRAHGAPKPPVDVEIAVRGLIVDAETGDRITEYGVETRTVETVGGQKARWFDPEPFPSPKVIASADGELDRKFSYHEDARLRRDWLRVVADGYLPQTVTDKPFTTADAEQGIEAIVRMRKGRTVRGRILRANGEPAKGAQVLTLREDGGITSTSAPALGKFFRDAATAPGTTLATADAEGHFVIEGVSPEGLLACHAPPLDLWIGLPPLGTNEWVVRLPDPGALRIRYRMEAQPAEASVFVRLVRPGDLTAPRDRPLQLQFHPVIRNGGEVVLERVPPGVYRLSRNQRVEADGYTYQLQTDESEVTVAAGKTATVTMTRDVGFPIEGVVQGLDAHGINTAIVAIESGKPIMSAVVDVVTSDETNHFRTSRIPAGKYSLRVYGYTEAALRQQAQFSGLPSPGLLSEVAIDIPERMPPAAITIAVPPPHGRPKAP